MITKTRARRSDLSDFFSLGEIPRASVLNKQNLIEMANNGAPRPSQKTKEGRALSEYTKPSSCCFDINFYKKISGIRPDWFVSQTEGADKKKQELIRMAKNGEPRPSYERTRIGQALSNYTRKSSHVYDAEFDKLIRQLRPDWF
jgi:hypothetical protein